MYHLLVFLILAIFISGCTGNQITGTSGTPVATPVSNQTAGTINVTAQPISGTTGHVISVTPTSGPALSPASSSGGITAKPGDMVSVNYTGWDENGSIFDTTMAEVARQAGIYDPKKIYAPNTFVIGSGIVISGFNDAVIGMSVGETRNVTLTPEQAYGQYNASLVQPVPMSVLANAGITPQVGQTIYCNHQPVKVLEIKEDGNALIDFNSPLVGHTLRFNITLLAIQPANTS